jgi:hypothetical protein
MKFLILLSILLLITQSAFSQESSLHDEAIKNLQEYLSIDTTNPPGNEMKTAVFLKRILDREGIENQIFDLGNNRSPHGYLKGIESVN